MTRYEARKWIKDTCGVGWLSLVDKVFDDLPPGVMVVEVFQKYGRLEFRLDVWDHPFQSYLFDIALESVQICEVCGALGSEQIVDGWIVTLCKPHFLEQSRKG